jgi:hypothetical protein
MHEKKDIYGHNWASSRRDGHILIVYRIYLFAEINVVQ